MNGERTVWVLTVAVTVAMIGVVVAVMLLAAAMSPIR